MSQPLFSVITITLNSAADAEQTARSVLEQNFTDVEYLVKDGVSTDGTIERLQALGVRVIVSPDTGIYDAMNQGIAHSRGRYLCFLNAGDRFAGPDVLATVAEALTRSGNPDFLYGDVRSFVNHPHLGIGRAGEGRLIRYPDRLTRFWLYRKMICQQVWFVRREIYLDRPFATDYRILADYAYLLDMVLRRRVRYYHLAKEVAIFDGGGVSTKASPRRDAERARALATVYAPWERRLYETVFGGMRWLNRTLFYPMIPLLPERWRARLSGL
ncbi:glycosyltransferase family 2 protein [Chloroflexus sp.]|uniref:glycosyltransferase family 2 protein n=1 Tax=Chloroflexus sp. TaxID=1904827 RepID=UPI002624FDBF|nr:glycosyltransferase family 2 protein [uncultured Chloroflexus sp.]